MWVIFGQKQGHLAKLKDNLVNTREAAFFASAA